MSQTYIKNYTNYYDIRGVEIKVTAPARFDSQTDKIVADMELDNQAVKIAQEKYRKLFAYVSPDEIKQLRKKWNLTQKQFAEVIGWSPSTVALYEVGEIPTTSNNRLLKILIKDPRVMEEFIAENKKSQELEG